MSGAYIAARAAAVLAAQGEAMILRRVGQADLAVMGKRFMHSRSAGASEFSNSASGTNLVIRIGDTEIAAAGWPGPPFDGDIIVLADDSKEWSVNKVDTRVSGGVVQGHFLYVDGN